MTPRLVVLSDLHISPPGLLASFHAPRQLAALLHANARPDTTLILAGDVFDFLQIERPSTLDMPGAPALFAKLLDGLAADPERRGILEGLGAVLRAGAPCVVMPGNHDPELHHPEARAVLLRALGVNGDAPLTFHTDDAPWKTAIDGLDILVGHGHRVDPWNDIDPAGVRQAIATAAHDVTLPPGSRLVLDVQNVFKQQLDAGGTQRFPFIDLLKPEVPAVPLLLCYLDARLAVSLLVKTFGLGVRTILRPFDKWVRNGPVLGTVAPTFEAVPGDAAWEKDALADGIARALAGELSQEERGAADSAMRAAQMWLEGVEVGAAGTLAAHGGVARKAARAALRALSEDGSFFDTSHLSAEDRPMVAAHLPEGHGPRVAIFGHTHAARHKVLDGNRTYINTGTWMDLMAMPAMTDAAAVEAWIDGLEVGHVPRLKRLTYAEVTAEGAFLREHPARP